jgi:uridine kinase
MTKPKIIAISGGSGSGKTTAAKMLQTLLGEENCQILSQDNYYKDQSRHFKGDGSINFDHPNAIDFPLMAQHLSQILNGETVPIPLYDFVTHTRKKETLLFSQKKYIIVDGILILSEEKLRDLYDTSLFLDIPEAIRFSRRLKRDVEERGRTPEGVHVQFYQIVKPMHDMFVSPLKQFAHYVAQTDEDVRINVEKIVQALLPNEKK